MRNIVTFFLIIIGLNCFSQARSIYSIKRNINGLCSDTVLIVYPEVDIESKRAGTIFNEEIIKSVVRQKVTSVNDKSKLNVKTRFEIIVNCNDSAVSFKVDSAFADSQIDNELAIALNYLPWQSGILGGKKIDSVTFLTIILKEGELMIEKD